MNTQSNHHAKKSAHALIQSGRYADAREIYQKLCNANKNDLDAWLMLGAIHGWLGDYNEAAACFRHVITQAPTHVRACYNLALALQQLGRQAEAIEYYRKATDIDPASLEAWCNLGTALHRQGDLPSATAALRQAAALNPAIPQIHIELASVLNAQGNHVEAIESANKALTVNPSIAEAWCQIGYALFRSGQRNQAVNAYREAVGINPAIEDAHLALATIFREERNFDQASIHLQTALKHNPDCFDALFELGNIWQIHGKSQRACACYERCIALRPERAEIYYNMGLAQEALGNHEEAITHYQKALAINPGYEAALAGLAHELEKRHRFDEALEAVKARPASGIRNARLASTSADIYRHFGRRDEAIELLEQNLEIGNNHDPDQHLVHFNLGRLYDQAGKYDDAFEQFRRANMIASHPFRIEDHRRFIGHCIDCFTKTAMPPLLRATLLSEQPVFIVGMPRSGTTLIEQVLSSHPRIIGAGELRDIQQIADDLSARPENRNASGPFGDLKSMSSDSLNELVRRYLTTLEELSKDAARTTDKMPHNFLYLGLIDRLFPNARVIHSQRNALDTCLSIYFQHFNANHGYSTSLQALGLYYREYRRLMAHWKKVIQIPMLEVRYEDLVNEPERISRAMIEFCGLDWDERCLRFHENKRVVNTPSYDQVRQPLYRKSVERWRNYEKHIGELIEALGPDAAG